MQLSEMAELDPGLAADMKAKARQRYHNSRDARSAQILAAAEKARDQDSEDGEEEMVPLKKKKRPRSI